MTAIRITNGAASVIRRVSNWPIRAALTACCEEHQGGWRAGRARRQFQALGMWLTLGGLLSSSTVIANDETLTRVRDLYQSAAYDEALDLLDGLQTDPASQNGAAIAEYRVFCLVALNRSAEARTAIAALVTANPFHQPSEAQASPRIRAAFREVRRDLFPGLVQRSYADARAAFDRKDPEAIAAFDRVVALLDDPEAETITGRSDLRTIVRGFRDLAKAVAAAAAPASPAPPAGEQTDAGLPQSVAQAAPVGRIDRAAPPPGTSPVHAAPAEKAASAARASDADRATETPVGRDGEAGAVGPVTLLQQLPRWIPSVLDDRRREFRGTLELVIDDTGSVVRATVQQSIHPQYDPLLLAAAPAWKYRPATRNGVPISFVKLVEIVLGPGR